VTYLIDTDTFSLFLQTDLIVTHNVFAHLFDTLLVSLVTVQEMWNGWATAIARAKTPAQLALGQSRLAFTLNELRNWTVVPMSAAAIARYESLKKQKLNVGGNDMRIAAIALETGATVVTRNLSDFTRIPGIVIEDWSV
jgi:tRNA(fMet)-specific endonuclease VapC